MTGFSIPDFSSIVLAATASVSLLYIARQTAVTKRRAKGRFLLSLEDQFDKVRDVAAPFAF